jgi:hypothetical protein
VILSQSIRPRALRMRAAAMGVRGRHGRWLVGSILRQAGITSTEFFELLH